MFLCYIKYIYDILIYIYIFRLKFYKIKYQIHNNRIYKIKKIVSYFLYIQIIFCLYHIMMDTQYKYNNIIIIYTTCNLLNISIIVNKIINCITITEISVKQTKEWCFFCSPCRYFQIVT